MGKSDTLKTAKRSIQAQEWALDIPPHKSIKKHKARERQMGKRVIEQELKDGKPQTKKK